MDALKKLPRETQVILGGTLLYVIFSFLNWQQASIGPYTVGRSEWHGVGVIAALIAVVLLVWEIGRAVEFKIELGALTPGMVSAGLELLLVVFTVITFLDWSDFRHWPEWLGLILSLVIAGFGFVRAKAEGVAMPNMPKNISVGGSSMGGSTGSTGSTAPSPPPEPMGSPDDSMPPDSTES